MYVHRQTITDTFEWWNIERFFFFQVGAGLGDSPYKASVYILCVHPGSWSQALWEHTPSVQAGLQNSQLLPEEHPSQTRPASPEPLPWHGQRGLHTGVPPRMNHSRGGRPLVHLSSFSSGGEQTKISLLALIRNEQLIHLRYCNSCLLPELMDRKRINMPDHSLAFCENAAIHSSIEVNKCKESTETYPSLFFVFLLLIYAIFYLLNWM